jgi:hypothetical protein
MWEIICCHVRPGRFGLLQGQRLLQLGVSAPTKVAGGYSITTTSPPSAVIAPSAYYMLFAVANGVPSVAAWVHIA